ADRMSAARVAISTSPPLSIGSMRTCCHKWEWSLSATMGLRTAEATPRGTLQAQRPRHLATCPGFSSKTRAVKSSVRARQPEATRTCDAVAVATGHCLFGGTEELPHAGLTTSSICVQRDRPSGRTTAPLDCRLEAARSLTRCDTTSG